MHRSMYRSMLLALLLPVLPAQSAEINPYRGDAAAIAQGAAVYQANCARCHGEQSMRPSAEAPDLRRLNAFCQQLKDTALQERCLQDVDAYFMMSVNSGKVRAGIVYMPPWRDVLSTQDIWAVRSFIESRPIDAPRLKTSVDAAH
nr:c-type cytochrome [uncultured Duganella sp.]